MQQKYLDDQARGYENQRNLSKQPVNTNYLHHIQLYCTKLNVREILLAQEWKIPVVVILFVRTYICACDEYETGRMEHDMCIQALNEAENVPISVTGCCMFFLLPECYKARHWHGTSEICVRGMLQCKNNRNLKFRCRLKYSCNHFE